MPFHAMPSRNARFAGDASGTAVFGLPGRQTEPCDLLRRGPRYCRLQDSVYGRRIGVYAPRRVWSMIHHGEYGLSGVR